MQLRSLIKRARACISRCVSRRRSSRNGVVNHAVAKCISLSHVPLIPLSKPSKKKKSSTSSLKVPSSVTTKSQRVSMSNPSFSTNQSELSIRPADRSMVCRRMSDNSRFDHVEYENIPVKSNGSSTNDWLLFSIYTSNGTTTGKVGWRFCGLWHHDEEVEP